MEKEQQIKKISAGKKNKIVINPPEKPPIKNVNERFKDALPKHTVVIEKKIALVLQAKANAAELPEQALIQVFTRGYKTLPLNSTLTREQYAMNRVNSFIAGGLAMQEDFDLLPIEEKFARLGMKGTGGARRPHIKREKSPYNNKVVYHVVDSKGVVKHSTSDEGEAKQHLAQKYNSYMGEARQMKGEDPCWKGYEMIGKKLKAGRQVPNCVPKNEEVEKLDELSVNKMLKYSDAAEKDRQRLNAKWDAGTASRKEQEKAIGREEGENRATNKIKKKTGKYPWQLNREETEQIDELSKTMKKSRTKGVAEATSVAVRMQRALDKIKADRERRERLAAPYIKSVFGKKDDSKPEPKKD